jgi:hypothetical protein
LAAQYRTTYYAAGGGVHIARRVAANLNTAEISPVCDTGGTADPMSPHVGSKLRELQLRVGKIA